MTYTQTDYKNDIHRLCELKGEIIAKLKQIKNEGQNIDVHDREAVRTYLPADFCELDSIQSRLDEWDYGASHGQI